jgi:hypothetical protein
LSSEDIRYVSANSENEKFRLLKGDVLVARIGATYGKTFIYEDNTSAIFASYLIRLRFDKVFYRSISFILHRAMTTGNKLIIWSQVRDNHSLMQMFYKLIRLPIPPKEDQERIIGQFEKERALILPARK